MGTHVYANDLEIAWKSTDGVATTAFPDPCWSPPPPKGGPILIPYGNTAFAPDITNGTCTVFIAGETVAIEDKAYFATSTGNEPATEAFAKGDKTSVIKGKAYFRSWSLDVVFEGLGVDRHTDMVSHNHGSMPSNTPLFPYISRGWFGGTTASKKKSVSNVLVPPTKTTPTQRKSSKEKARSRGFFKAARDAVALGAGIVVAGTGQTTIAPDWKSAWIQLKRPKSTRINWLTFSLRCPTS